TGHRLAVGIGVTASGVGVEVSRGEPGRVRLLNEGRGVDEVDGEEQRVHALAAELLQADGYLSLELADVAECAAVADLVTCLLQRRDQPIGDRYVSSAES